MTWEYFLICVKSIFPNIDTSTDRRFIRFPTYGNLINKECEDFWVLFPNGKHDFVNIDYLTEEDVILSLREYKKNKKNKSIFSK